MPVMCRKKTEKGTGAVWVILLLNASDWAESPEIRRSFVRDYRQGWCLKLNADKFSNCVRT